MPITSSKGVIPFIEFFKEIERDSIEYKFQPPIVYCKLFEDNSAALEIARVSSKLINKTTISSSSS